MNRKKFPDGRQLCRWAGQGRTGQLSQGQGSLIKGNHSPPVPSPSHRGSYSGTEAQMHIMGVVQVGKPDHADMGFRQGPGHRADLQPHT